MSDVVNAGQIQFWNQWGATSWIRMQARLDHKFAPLTRLGMEALAPRPGERVLDIGCGCGTSSLDLARVVGSGGAVLGADVSAPMIEVARAQAADAGLSQAVYVEADAQTYPFEPGGWDAVFSRFGVMFFADPEAAFANLRRGVKPEGRLTFLCWGLPEGNEHLDAIFEATMAHFPPRPAPPPKPDGPPPLPPLYSLHDADRTRGLLEGAGWTGVELQRHDTQIGVPTVDDAVALALHIGSLPYLIYAHPESVPAVTETLRDGYAKVARPEGVMENVSLWVVTARNP